MLVLLMNPIAFLTSPLSLQSQFRKSLLGSFSNDKGDGNENAKKAMGLLSKTTTLHVHHAFLYISLLSLHDYHLKMPDFTLYGGRLTFSADWNKRDNV